ncbi:MAG TPA: copper resistance CopC family protein [Streptosporangiaceae bacterium]|nr:copper resistance CopC family protein [Streptosporangiaceae bacterium]
MIAGTIISAAFLVASVAPTAAAHTALKASSPKDGGKIGVAPSRLLLEFTSPMISVGSRIVVEGPDGRAYQAGAPQITDDKVTQPLKPLGPAGEYRVEFRVVAYDGHPLSGGMRFTLTKPGPAEGGAEAVQPAPLVAVSSSSVNNAPSWAPWLGGALAVILLSGAVLFGRRATRDLD